MKTAIHHWGLPREFDLNEKLRLTHELGFDGVELGISRGGEISPELSSSELRDIRNMADTHGLKIHSLTCTLNWEASATSGIGEIREKARKTLMRQIDIAHHLGADAVLALPGFVALDFTVNSLCGKESGGSYSPSQEVVPYDAAYERSIDFFGGISDYAKAAGVTVCVENIWNHFLLSPLEMRNFIDEIGSEYVQSYFDVANVMPSGFADQWINILGKRIKRVHFKDYILSSNSINGFTGLLEGDVDFRAVMQALDNIGYDGWITAEVNSLPNDGGRTADKAFSAMKKIIGGI